MVGATMSIQKKQAKRIMSEFINPKRLRRLTPAQARRRPAKASGLAKRALGKCGIRLVGFCFAVAFCLLASGLNVTAQVAVPVGAGSYASYVPLFDQQTDEYYAIGAQQIIDLYPNLHLAPSLANRPMPSNKWWTDVLMGIRSWSYNATNNPPSVV